MSSLTISSTTAIVTPPEPASPSNRIASATETANAAVESPQPQPPQPPSLRRPRWPIRSTTRACLAPPSWYKGLKLMRVQQCFLVGVAVLELLSIIIIVVVNAAGQNSDRFEVSAPGMYLLNWTKNVSTDAGRDNQTETFTLYWYLNGACIQNGTGPLEPLSRQLGADFNWRQFDNEAIHYIRKKEHPPKSCGAIPAITLPIPRNGSINGTSSTNSTDSTTAASNTTTTGCRLPTADEVTDPPPALNSQPAFGRVSFAFYILDIAVTLLAWPLLLFLNGSKLWQKRGRIIMACTKTFATTTNVVAATLLVSGISWVTKHTSKDGATAGSFTDQDNSPAVPLTDDAYPLANNMLVNRAAPNATTSANSTMPAISGGPTAPSLIWISVTSQVFACVFFIAACLLISQQQRSQGERLGSGSGRSSRPNMRQRPGSLPVYRPSDSNARRRGEDGEEYEDLPPYQRDDPLGRPPSIPGYTISNGCTVTYISSATAADCIPLHRVTSSDASASTSASATALTSSQSLAPGLPDSSGRRSPSPDYEEVVGVEPVSLLSRDGTGTQHHGPALVIASGSSTVDEVSGSRSNHGNASEGHASQALLSVSHDALLPNAAPPPPASPSIHHESPTGTDLTNGSPPSSASPPPPVSEAINDGG